MSLFLDDPTPTSGAPSQMVDVVGPDGTHTYWSTHCRHGRHEDCAATELAPGVPRQPAQCKVCAAPCVCPCGHGLPEADPQLAGAGMLQVPEGVTFPPTSLQGVVPGAPTPDGPANLGRLEGCTCTAFPDEVHDVDCALNPTPTTGGPVDYEFPEGCVCHIREDVDKGDVFQAPPEGCRVHTPWAFPGYSLTQETETGCGCSACTCGGGP